MLFNPYISTGNDILITKRKKPICNVPEIVFGNMPNDGGYLLFDHNEYLDILKREKGIQKFIYPLISAREYLHNKKRWCFWLYNADPSEYKKYKTIVERISLVKKIREESNREATKKLSKYPSLFGEIRQPSSDYILIPRHTSENRNYIPFGLFDPSYIVHDSCLCIPNANLYILGIISSKMHMTWIKSICGRIKGDFRYSNEVVYNNFPWPISPSTENINKVELLIKNVFNIRKEFSQCSLSDLYDPISMPPKLVKTHHELDRAVDKCYRSQPFTRELNRLEYLFNLYENYLKR